MFYWFSWQLPWRSPCILKFIPCFFLSSLTINVILSMKGMPNLSLLVSVFPSFFHVYPSFLLIYFLKNDSHSAKNYINRFLFFNFLHLQRRQSVLAACVHVWTIWWRRYLKNELELNILLYLQWFWLYWASSQITSMTLILDSIKMLISVEQKWNCCFSSVPLKIQTYKSLKWSLTSC